MGKRLRREDLEFSKVEQCFLNRSEALQAAAMVLATNWPVEIRSELSPLTGGLLFTVSTTDLSTGQRWYVWRP